jgi:hypothetical protein
VFPVFILKLKSYTYNDENKDWQKYLNSPIMHSSIPTIRASKIANSVYTSLDESATLPRTLETNRETNATGPTASWREDPNMAYTNMGTKPESSLQREKH